MVHLRQTYLLWKLKALEHFWFCYKWRGGSFSFVCGSKKWQSRQDSVINISGCVGSLVEKKCCDENWIGFGLQKLLSPSSGSVPRGISNWPGTPVPAQVRVCCFTRFVCLFFPYAISFSFSSRNTSDGKDMPEGSLEKRNVIYIHIYVCACV